MNIKVSQFSPDYAEILIDLTNRAFKAFSKGVSPKDTVEFIRHLNGDSNPAGPAWCAMALEDDQCIGNVTAIPMRFIGKRGYQIGGFFVDQKHQRKGIGKDLLFEITSELNKKPNAFIYTFPNLRSIEIFYRMGYKFVAKIPTYILPWKRGTSDLEIKSPSEKLIEKVKVFHSGGIIRDTKFFEWRYCGPGADTRYKFITGRSNASIDFVAVITNHQFNKIPFIVLVDILASSPKYFQAAFRAAQGQGKLTYVNTNIPKRYLPFFRVSIPDRVNPRPVNLLVYPGDFDGRKISEGIITGDWLGF